MNLSAGADERLGPAARAAVRAFTAAECARALVAGHASRVRLHVGADGLPRRTPRATLLISGLYNSPAVMSALEEIFFGRGENVISLRLAGHYEVDPEVLRSQVRWPEWRAQSRAAFALATELGHR